MQVPDDAAEMKNRIPQAARLPGLLREALAGRAGADDQFFDVMVDIVLRLTKQIAGSRGVGQEGIEDLSQEIVEYFLRRVRERPEALLKIEEWDGYLAFVIWKRTYGYFRRRGDDAREMEVLASGEYATLVIAATPLGALEDALAEESSGEALQEYWRRMHRFFEEASVPQRTRDIFKLHAGGKTFAEIGAALGLTGNACNLRYHKMLKKLDEWRATAGAEHGHG